MCILSFLSGRDSLVVAQLNKRFVLCCVFVCCIVIVMLCCFLVEIVQFGFQSARYCFLL